MEHLHWFCIFAVLAETAKTLSEAGVINPNGLKVITERLVKWEAIKRTSEGRFIFSVTEGHPL